MPVPAKFAGWLPGFEPAADEADDWVGYNLLPGGGMATTEVAVGEYNGRFVVCYATGNETSATRETVVAMANSADPMTAGDWTRVVIDGTHGGTCDVIVYDGRLAVGYSDFRGYGDVTRRPLFVARALNTNPVNPSDWLIEQVDSFNYGGHLSLFVLGDKLNAIWSSSFNLEYFAGWRQAAY